MPLNDAEILALCRQGMITPFVDHQVREVNGNKVLSYGVSSFGYDARLGHDVTIFKTNPEAAQVIKDLMVIDPKAGPPLDIMLQRFETEEPWLLPAHSYALTVSLERFSIPADVVCMVIGKSTYARCGVIVNVTPLEPEWEGYITIELANVSDYDVRIYPGEGVMQVLFERGRRPMHTYKSRPGGPGKYHGQGAHVVMPKV